MMQNPADDIDRIDEFWAYLRAACDGSLTSEGRDALEQMLRENSELKSKYIEYIGLHAELTWRYRLPNEGELAMPPETASTSSTEHTAPSYQKGSAKGFSSAEPVRFQVLRGFSWRDKATAPGVLAAIAVLVIASLVTYQVVPRRAVVADAQPNAKGSNGAGTELPSVSSLRVDSGTATLLIPKVGHVVVEGPAQFDLIGPMRARLEQGRMMMHVTEPTGRGFVVETRNGEVTDLGTKFGLDLSDKDGTGLVVFEGKVDLRVANQNPSNSSRPQRLVEGEGVVFGPDGKFDRINTIVTGALGTFKRSGLSDGIPASPTIAYVTDNRQASQTKKFYEIVPGGMQEDALKYVDRPHQWNGLTEKGMPSYLLGADYVKTFNSIDDALEVYVTILQPAELYVLFDDRLDVPEWLSRDFMNTGDKIGSDSGRWGKQNKTSMTGVGPGISVELIFSVWKRVLDGPATVTLGGRLKMKKRSPHSMYGIAAVPLGTSAAAVLPVEKRNASASQ